MPIRKNIWNVETYRNKLEKNVITLSKNIFLEFSTNLLTDSFPMMKRRTLASSKVGSSPSSAPPPSSSAFSEKIQFWRLRLDFGILLPKLFWPTVRKNCSSDREKLLKFEAEGREFSNFLRSLELFVQIVKGRNKFGNWYFLTEIVLTYYEE